MQANETPSNHGSRDGPLCPLVGSMVGLGDRSKCPHLTPQGGSTLVNATTVTLISFLVILVISGCGTTSAPLATPTGISTPVLRLPDMVENALRSIVEIQTTFGGGSGFIINSDGLVVTNKHVIEGASRVTLRETSGNSFGADVVGGHPTLDLAYIQIANRPGQFTPIAIGDSDTVRVGESVIVIGFPIADALGSEPTVSQGIVSARRDGLIQTDAPVNPGNSGLLSSEVYQSGL